MGWQGNGIATPILAATGTMLFCSALISDAMGQQKPRARQLGIALEGTSGPLNAITDVAGVEVGHVTLIRGEGTLVVGQGPVRTGVTAILPRGRTGTQPVFGGWFTLNAAGEMTGTTWVEERGLVEGPVLITNTHSVGVVRDAAIEWMLKNGWQFRWAAPVVGETYDGRLNDINGFHVKKAHVFDVLDGARSGPVAEGNVGGGTGMICHQFKGGIGTASRRLPAEHGGYTIGVLVQCNYGRREQLRIAGAPVGEEIRDILPDQVGGQVTGRGARIGDGSIIIVIATDAPLLPHQLKRVAKRGSLGIARMGGVGDNGSGDIFIAFSTANPGVTDSDVPPLRMLPNNQLTPIFEATTQATEEAIINALLAAETTIGAEAWRVHALPHNRLAEVLRKYNRLRQSRHGD